MSILWQLHCHAYFVIITSIIILPHLLCDNSTAPTCLSHIFCDNSPTCLSHLFCDNSTSPTCLPHLFCDNSTAPTCLSNLFCDNSTVPTCLSCLFCDNSTSPTCLPCLCCHHFSSPQLNKFKKYIFINLQQMNFQAVLPWIWLNRWILWCRVSQERRHYLQTYSWLYDRTTGHFWKHTHTLHEYTNSHRDHTVIILTVIVSIT